MITKPYLRTRYYEFNRLLYCVMEVVEEDEFGECYYYPHRMYRYESHSGELVLGYWPEIHENDAFAWDRTESQFWQEVEDHRLSKSKLPTSIEAFMKLNPTPRIVHPGDEAVQVKEVTFDLAELKTLHGIVMQAVSQAASDEDPKPEFFRHSELSKKLEYFLAEYDSQP
ncbi:hypothetical protein CLV84_4309 [Neolewinella xylanilytica]|uniref:Uncharacterized protein n=1 Tax=Neolewinella xylanilytica TaxID=1514080 RepID=A0A2S6I015_9BACT|nr:hypothetical protein [Neolewinella xylanilytica]PPK83936.1 hypothetical protein CLV84_4309 [Neolewinella xylanilytica]